MSNPEAQHFTTKTQGNSFLWTRMEILLCRSTPTRRGANQALSHLVCLRIAAGQMMRQGGERIMKGSRSKGIIHKTWSIIGAKNLKMRRRQSQQDQLDQPHTKHRRAYARCVKNFTGGLLNQVITTLGYKRNFQQEER